LEVILSLAKGVRLHFTPILEDFRTPLPIIIAQSLTPSVEFFLLIVICFFYWFCITKKSLVEFDVVCCFQAMIMIQLLGWVFAPVYIASGVRKKTFTGFFLFVCHGLITKKFTDEYNVFSLTYSTSFRRSQVSFWQEM